MREVVKKKKSSHNPEQSEHDAKKDISGNSLATVAHGDALSLIDLAGQDLTAAMHSGLGIPSPFTRDIFLMEKASVVGMRFQGGSLDLLREIKLGSRITLIREPDNTHDKKAIVVLDEQDRKLGYISRYENTIPSALMDAGKTLYGIVSHIPRPGELFQRPPAALYADLYMREFATPDDLSQIPRQGCRGSYVVMDLELTDDEDAKIKSAFAIRVINGEERGVISAEAGEEEDSAEAGENEHSDEADETGDPAAKEINTDGECSTERLIRKLWMMTGYLPVVLCDFSGRQQEALETGWGVYTGRPFSNQVIEICEMARNHLPELRNLTLEGIVDRLGIEDEGELPAEIRCRQILKIYCRLDRSELDRRRGPAPEPWHRKKYKVALDTPISQLRLTQELRERLVSQEIDVLWEVSRLTWKEACTSFGRDCMGELEELLADAGVSFRPENDDDVLYGYPKRVREIAEDRIPLWKVFLFIVLFKMRCSYLRKVRRQKVRLASSTWIDETPAFVSFAMKELKYLVDALCQFKDAIEKLDRAINLEDDEECVKGMCGSIDILCGAYKKFMAFTRRIRQVGGVELYREIIDGLAQQGEQLCCETVDTILNRCIDIEKTIGDYLAGRISPDDVDISVTVHINDDTIEGLKKKILELMVNEE